MLLSIYLVLPWPLTSLPAPDRAKGGLLHKYVFGFACALSVEGEVVVESGCGSSPLSLSMVSYCSNRSCMSSIGFRFRFPIDCQCQQSVSRSSCSRNGVTYLVVAQPRHSPNEPWSMSRILVTPYHISLSSWRMLRMCMALNWAHSLPVFVFRSLLELLALGERAPALKAFQTSC